MKRIMLAALVLVFAAEPMLAQEEDKDIEHEPLKQIQRARKRENAAIDKQYQRTLDATRGADAAPVKVDPWANMRGSNTATQKK